MQSTVPVQLWTGTKSVGRFAPGEPVNRKLIHHSNRWHFGVERRASVPWRDQAQFSAFEDMNPENYFWLKR
jgi:hypothetical protein